MSDYRNIDRVIVDTKYKAITVGPFGRKTNDSEIPAISDIVALITDRGYTMADNCWEFCNCPDDIKKKCQAYLSDSGRECWLVAGHIVSDDSRRCLRLLKEHKDCFGCPWFKKLHADDTKEHSQKLTNVANSTPKISFRNDSLTVLSSDGYIKSLTELNFKQKQIWVEGLMIACPMDKEQEDCPLREIRKLSLTERLGKVKQMDEKQLDEIIKHHKKCLQQLEHRDRKRPELTLLS